MKQQTLTIMIVGVMVVGGLLVGAPGATAAEMDGKALFTDAHKCSMCHAVPAEGIEAKTKSKTMKGGDLGGKIDAEFAEIAAYLRKEGEIDGKSHKKPFKGTDEELQTILDWLGTLEAQTD